MKKFPINRYNIVIVFLALAFGALTIIGFQTNSVVKSAQQGRSPYRYSEGLEDVYFPYDEEEAAAIDESDPIAEGETWAVYMYLNGSNLELNGHSQLSSFVEFIVDQEVKEATAQKSADSLARINEFISTEAENNIPMPISFYDEDFNHAVDGAVPEESHEVSKAAWGSDILDVIRQAELPDNVTFVVQPGGAKAWRDPQVNPNRTRRFVKQGDELVEVYDAPISNMGKSETLSDFLTFCRENYPADHTMVILTDHGGAMNGFGWDYIYGDDNLTLKELTEAFDSAYGLNEKDPAVDLLYFNACLMSNTDVINSMRGVTKYMIAGEEVGLAMSDYYGTFFEKFCEDPQMNAEQLGKTLIDTYTQRVTSSGQLLGEPQITGMCLLDMKKAPLVYDAYAEFARTVLEDVADNPKTLARLTRAVAGSINFAVDFYKVYNVTDLGLWVKGLSDLYPDDSAKIIELINDAVIYQRADGYLHDAMGISVYFPNYVENTKSLSVALNYIDNISYSPDISALYYYKLAGCLNEKYKTYCEEAGIKLPDTINYAAMSLLRNSELTAVDELGNVAATIDADTYPILTDARYELCKVDEINNTVTYYGEDRFVGSDGATGIKTDFEGEWVCIGSTPFYVRVINVYDNFIIYESPVMYQDYEHKLIIQCEVIDENGINEYTILGLRHPYDDAATLDRNVEVLRPGSYITPIYYTSDIAGGEITQVNGSTVLYSLNTRIQDEKLSGGTYRVRIVYENMRGEDVFSEPVYFTA